MIFGIPVALAIGAIWEIYEVFDGMANVEMQIGGAFYKMGTVKDLVVDSLGAAFILYFRGPRQSRDDGYAQAS